MILRKNQANACIVCLQKCSSTICLLTRAIDDSLPDFTLLLQVSHQADESLLHRQGLDVIDSASEFNGQVALLMMGQCGGYRSSRACSRRGRSSGGCVGCTAR